MKKVNFLHSIQLKFIIIYILLLVIAIQVIGSYVTRTLEDELLSNFKQSINDRIVLLENNLEQAFKKDKIDDQEESTLQSDVQTNIADVERESSTTIQVIDSQGRVLGTNDYLNQEIIGKKTTDRYVQSSITFGTSHDNTELNTRTGERMFIRVEPIIDHDEQVLGVVYLETSLEGVYRQLQKINETFYKGSAIALIVSVMLGILVARAITNPVVEMRRQALTMARGDFSQKVKVYGNDEISQLAVTFNHLNDRLKHSMATIENEQVKLKSVLENMSEGVISTDSTGEIILVNEAAGQLLNENPMTLLGQSLLKVLKLQKRVNDISELHDNGSLLLDIEEEEASYIIRANFTAIDSGLNNEEKSGYITVLSDVTEEEKIERERKEFVSNVSHELRTPLTTLRSYLEALTDGAWKDEEIAPKFLRVTEEETERLIRMVNSLLQLSKMDNKEFTLNKGRIEFNKFFHQIIDRFELNVKDERITFRRIIPKANYYAWIDKDKMTQVLDNIISNAIKYSPDGGNITCQLKKTMNHIEVSIRDEGIGISYDKLDRIFDRFYRTDKARSRQLGGTGLGLAITKEIVEAHYGRIWAKSTGNQGTAIHFTLPLMKEKRGETL